MRFLSPPGLISTGFGHIGREIGARGGIAPFLLRAKDGHRICSRGAPGRLETCCDSDCHKNDRGDRDDKRKPPVTQYLLEGAARFLAGWPFTTRRYDDLDSLPDQLREALLEHVHQTGEVDNLARAEAAFRRWSGA